MPKRRTRSKKSQNSRRRRTRRRIQRGGAISNINEWVEAAVKARDEIRKGGDTYIRSQPELQFVDESAGAMFESMTPETIADYGIELVGQKPKDIRLLMPRIKTLLTNEQTGQLFSKEDLLQFLQTYQGVDVNKPPAERDSKFNDIYFLNDVENAIQKKNDPAASVNITLPEIEQALPLFIQLLAANVTSEEEKREIPILNESATQAPPSLQGV